MIPRSRLLLIAASTLLVAGVWTVSIAAASPNRASDDTSIPDPTPTVTITVTAEPTGPQEVTLSPELVQELRTVLVDDSAAETLASPFIDQFVPAITVGVALLVGLAAWSLVHSWGRS